jgi:hypothetical protein
MSYEQSISEIVRYVRERLQTEEDAESFSLTITASGRVHEGDIEIVCTLDHPYKYNVKAEGGDLDSIIEEHIRRSGWQKRHKPLCLPNVKTIEAKPEINDEIPF